ncbi:MAG: M48 family metalloprotease [Planctomycetota bacterium]
MMTRSINIIKAAMILALVLIAFASIGLAAGHAGVLVGVAAGALVNTLIFFFNDAIVVSAMCGVDADRRQFAELIRLTQRLADREGLPRPRVVISPQHVPNAFAAGRSPKHATIGFTQGAIDLLTTDELAGVIGHQLARIKNRDTLLSSIVITLSGSVTHLCIWASRVIGLRWGLQQAVLVSIPTAAALVRLSIRRKRDFLADIEGAKIAGSAKGLISALIKMDALAAQAVMASVPINDHLLTIGLPPTDRLSALFSAHPPVAERVRRLQQHASLG